MHILMALIGVGIWALMATLSLNASVKMLGSYIYNPFVKMLVGSLIIIICGAVFMLGGFIAILPFTLLFNGHIGWAVVALVVELFLSMFTKITYSGVDVGYNTPLWLRMVLGMALLWIGGPIVMLLGVILASPVLLIAFAVL